MTTNSRHTIVVDGKSFEIVMTHEGSITQEEAAAYWEANKEAIQRYSVITETKKAKK